MIEKLKRDGNGWIDDEGGFYETRSYYLQVGFLGLCGCGNPDEVMEYVYQGLVKLDKKEWGDYDDMAYMFFVYWANDRNFAEHGTSVRCSWLTDYGKELLRDIETVTQEKDKDETH